MPRRRGSPEDAARVRRLRAFGLGPTEIAAGLGVSRAMVGHIEREFRPISPEVGRRLARLEARAGAEQLTGWTPQCSGVPSRSVGVAAVMDHVETCPFCIRRIVDGRAV